MVASLVSALSVDLDGANLKTEFEFDRDGHVMARGSPQDRLNPPSRVGVALAVSRPRSVCLAVLLTWGYAPFPYMYVRVLLTFDLAKVEVAGSIPVVRSTKG